MAESSTSDKLKNSKPERTYKCTHCLYSCFNPDSLAKHILCHGEVNTKTTLLYTHICALCPYSCTNPDILKKHERSHNNADPNSTENTPKFSCELCPSFSSGSPEVFNKHKESHINVGSFKTYACENCSFTCRSYGGLKTHVRTCVDCIINEESSMLFLDTHAANIQKYPNRELCFYCKKWFNLNVVDFHHAFGCSTLADFMNEP